VLIGYGTTGATAAQVMAADAAHSPLVVLDIRPAAVTRAERAGLVGVVGDGTDPSVLMRAGVADAACVVVAVASDTTAVRITERARELNARCVIVTVVREAEHSPPVRRGGADRVVVSADTAGRLLAMSVADPAAAELVQGLLTGPQGVEVRERPPRPEELGRPVRCCQPMALALIRAGVRYWYNDARIGVVQPGDRLLGW
jgi:voltage-gated potassium channel